MSVAESLWHYLHTLLPPVRPTPPAETLARHPTVHAFLAMLPGHWLVDPARQVVSDVSATLGSPGPAAAFVAACTFDAVRGAWVLRRGAAQERWVMHMGLFPCVALVCSEIGGA
jgi:hypothetical protein